MGPSVLPSGPSQWHSPPGLRPFPATDCAPGKPIAGRSLLGRLGSGDLDAGLIDPRCLASCVPCAPRALRACVVRRAPFLPPLPPWRPWLVWLRVRPRLPPRHVGLPGRLGLGAAWGAAPCGGGPGWPGRRRRGGRARGGAQHVVGGGGRGSRRSGEPAALGVAIRLRRGARGHAGGLGAASGSGRAAGRADVSCRPGSRVETAPDGVSGLQGPRGVPAAGAPGAGGSAPVPSRPVPVQPSAVLALGRGQPVRSLPAGLPPEVALPGRKVLGRGLVVCLRLSRVFLPWLQRVGVCVCVGLRVL